MMSCACWEQWHCGKELITPVACLFTVLKGRFFFVCSLLVVYVPMPMVYGVSKFSLGFCDVVLCILVVWQSSRGGQKLIAILIAYTSSEGSNEPAQMYNLTRAFRYLTQDIVYDL